MTLRNTPTIQEIAEHPARLRGLPLIVLAELTDEAKAAKSLAETVAKAIASEIENRFAEPIAAAYRAEAKDTGTVHVHAEGFDIEASRTKKVEWDQSALAGAKATIEGWGENPAEYLKISLAVDERAFQAWPSRLRELVEPARSVRPGPLTIKLAHAGSKREAA